MKRVPNLRCWLLAGVLWAVGAAPGFGAGTDVPEPDETTLAMVDALVEDLAAGNKAQRASARRQLLQLGSLAHSRIQALLTGTEDGYLRQVLHDLLREIEDAAPAQQRLPVRRVEYPSEIEPIHLNLGQTTLEEALGKLGEAVGAPVVLGEIGLRRRKRWPAIVSRIERGDVSFWEATEALSDAFDVAVSYAQGALRVEPRFAQGESGGTSGPILVRFDRFDRSQSFRFAGDEPAQTSFFVRLHVFADPRLHPTGTARILLEQVEDIAGNSMLNPEGTGIFSLAGGTSSPMIPLPYPTQNPGDRMRILRGRIVIDMVREAGVFTIEDLSSAQEQSVDIAGVRIRIREWRQIDQEARTFDLLLGVQNRRLSGREWRDSGWNQHAQVNESIRVIDAEEKPIRAWLVGTAAEEDGFLLTIRVQAEGTQPPKHPLRLRMEVPVKTQPISVPFEFRDLPIP